MLSQPEEDKVRLPQGKVYPNNCFGAGQTAPIHHSGRHAGIYVLRGTELSRRETMFGLVSFRPNRRS